MYRYGIVFRDKESGCIIGLMSFLPYGIPAFRRVNTDWFRLIRRESVREEVFIKGKKRFEEEDIIYPHEIYWEFMKDFIACMLPEDLWQKYNIPFLQVLPVKSLLFELQRIAFTVNRYGYYFKGHLMKAQIVALKQEYSSGGIPFFEIAGHRTRWTNYIREESVLKNKRFKTVYSHYADFFKMPEDMIDIVSYEEFNQIETHRMPIFAIVRFMGIGPNPQQLNGFYNGEKLVATIIKVGNDLNLHIATKEFMQEAASMYNFIDLELI